MLVWFICFLACFSLILYGTLLAFCTWVAISIPLLGNFWLQSLQMFSHTFFFFSSFSEISIIQMLVHLMLSSFLFIPLNFRVCSPSLGLDQCLVKVSWLGGLVFPFQLELFNLGGGHKLIHSISLCFLLTSGRSEVM